MYGPTPTTTRRAPPPPPTPREMHGTRRIVERTVGDDFSSYGVEHDQGIDKPGIYEVTLLPGREAIAAELERLLPDSLRIAVGDTAYCHGIGNSPSCPTIQAQDALPAG